MLKVESLDAMTPAGVMEPRLASALARFLKGANLLAVTQPYSRR
jgi:hypothetical protein